MINELSKHRKTFQIECILNTIEVNKKPLPRVVQDKPEFYSRAKVLLTTYIIIALLLHQSPHKRAYGYRYFERDSACTFMRKRCRMFSIGFLVLLTIPITSAPSWSDTSNTQMTTSVTQFASCDAATDWITASNPKNAAIP